MLRARLNPMLLRLTALGRTERGTMSPTDACHAGPFTAVAQPIKKVRPSNIHGVSMACHAAMARTPETTSMKHWQASITLRRSRLSATAPAQSDSSMIGSVVAAGTSATIIEEPESEVIIHAAPTDWMRPPKFEERLASQMARKMGMERGDGAVGESASDTS